MKDVYKRQEREYAQGHFQGSVNIPLDELRERLSELDPQKPVYVNCHSGLRSYLACRILTGNGFECYNFSGGYRFYEYIAGDRNYDETPRPVSYTHLDVYKRQPLKILPSIS